MITLGFKVNGVAVFEGESETWSSAMLNQRTLRKFGDDLIKDIEIDQLKATSQVASEFLDAVIQKDSLPTGYEKFNLKIKHLQTPLEESVMERVQEKLQHV